eukprot:TRINITY_DN1637_c2_g1_i2.p1 TRINITY_DN1637_c2_g1~~TRINITY_DN1637_c2_g1_i2.p1  ORF type:complete len:194 (+),score=52.44 TRINITY_DN1637_c2_g1_i2:77-583(+)
MYEEWIGIVGCLVVVGLLLVVVGVMWWKMQKSKEGYQKVCEGEVDVVEAAVSHMGGNMFKIVVGAHGVGELTTGFELRGDADGDAKDCPRVSVTTTFSGGHATFAATIPVGVDDPADCHWYPFIETHEHTFSYATLVSQHILKGHYTPPNFRGSDATSIDINTIQGDG